MVVWQAAISKPWPGDSARCWRKITSASGSGKSGTWASCWTKEFLPHIPQDQFPAQSLAVALYRDYGIRGVEIGTVMFGKKDAATGRTVHPELEMVRLAIPRRVYTNMQITYVAESIIDLFRRREGLRGLTLTYEAPMLRHFTARFEETEDKPVMPSVVSRGTL
jgi:tryptophanase